MEHEKKSDDNRGLDTEHSKKSKKSHAQTIVSSSSKTWLLFPLIFLSSSAQQQNIANKAHPILSILILKSTLLKRGVNDKMSSFNSYFDTKAQFLHTAFPDQKTSQVDLHIQIFSVFEQQRVGWLCLKVSS